MQSFKDRDQDNIYFHFIKKLNFKLSLLLKNKY